jgi:hypothetical protein
MSEASAGPVPAQGELPVFISWSLPLAEQVAKTLRQWLVEVVPGINPWFSGDDIETGKFWQLELFKSLERSTVGIVVITPANANRPWLNFEAGRLSSSIESRGGVVMPLLLNLELADIIGSPLSTLNAVTFNEDGVWKIVQAIHERTAVSLTETMLKGLFDLRWGELSTAVKDAIDAAVANDVENASPEKRETAVVLEDLVSEVRELRQDVRRNTGDMVGSWSPINESAVQSEVRSIVAASGVIPADVRVIDIHRNGVIYLEIDFDEDVDERQLAQIEMQLRGAPRYRPTIKFPHQEPNIIVMNRGGTRVVGPTNPREQKE